MKYMTSAMAALALSAMITTGTTTQAKADGGAIAIGVGVFLLTDAIVGRACHRDDWPFNIFAKVADELHGRHGCYRGHHNDGHQAKPRRKHRH